jgi:hypothetical protein
LGEKYFGDNGVFQINYYLKNNGCLPEKLKKVIELVRYFFFSNYLLIKNIYTVVT